MESARPAPNAPPKAARSSTAAIVDLLPAEAVIDDSNGISLEEAYKSIGLRTYELKGGDKENLHFFVLGCQGSAKQAQKDVADLMARIAKDPHNRPDFILLTGDNFYDNGVLSPLDPAFNEYFYTIYKPLIDLGIPFIVQPGNHDANRHAKTFGYNATISKTVNATSLLQPIGEEVEKSQYMHSFLREKDKENAAALKAAFEASKDPNKKLPVADSKKLELYSQPTLDVNKLPSWNMPFGALSVHKGDAELFCINSNTYVRDYLLYQKYLKNSEQYAKDYPNDPIAYNQAKWLKEGYEAARAGGRKVIISAHHTLETEGKRAFADKFDSCHYLDDKNNEHLELNALKELLGTHSESYNELYALTLEQQGIFADQNIGAHDHFINNRNTKNNPEKSRKFCQLTVGGGGGDHHLRKSFLGHPDSTHIEGYGFTEIRVAVTKPTAINYDIYTTDGLHLKFNDQSTTPIREVSPDKEAEALREKLLAEANRFLAKLKQDELQKREEEIKTKNTASQAAAAAAAAPTPTSFIGWTTSTLYKVGATVTTAVGTGYEKVKKHFIPDPWDASATAIHYLMAYLNQAESLPSVEKIKEELKNYFVGKNIHRDTYAKGALELIFDVLNLPDLPKSKSMSSMSPPLVQNPPSP